MNGLVDIKYQFTDGKSVIHAIYVEYSPDGTLAELKMQYKWKYYLFISTCYMSGL
jgi:hypothetical protein